MSEQDQAVTATEGSNDTSTETDGALETAGERNHRKTRQGYVVSDKMDKTVVVEVEDRGRRKVLSGIVVSDKMDKTIVVMVEDRVKHPLYGKVIRRTSKVKAHDEKNDAGVGDRVLIMETRPLSATKRWRIVEILEKAK